MSPIPIVDEQVDAVPGPVLADYGPNAPAPEPLVDVDSEPVQADYGPNARDSPPHTPLANGVDGSHADHGPSVAPVKTMNTTTMY